MTWTIDNKVEALIRLPWSVRIERDDPDGAYVAVCSELPSVVASGASERELDADFFESLRETLRCYLEAGDEPPLPNCAKLPWLDRPRGVFVIVQGARAEESVVATSGGGASVDRVRLQAAG